MKLLTSILLNIILLTSVIYTQTEDPPYLYELKITHNVYGGNSIFVRLYPVSMVFNGLKGTVGDAYNLLASFPKPNPAPEPGFWWDYVNGVGINRTNNGGNWINEVKTYHELSYGESIYFNWDEESTAPTEGAFGCGVYKVEIANNEYFIDADSVLFDQDDYGIGDNTIAWEPEFITYGEPKIVYYGEDFGRVVVNYYNEDDYFIKPWKRIGRARNPGNFKFSNDSPYDIIPFDCRRDCNKTSILQNHYFPQNWEFVLPNNDVRQGNLTLWLTIQKPVSTPSLTQIYDPDPQSYKVYTNQISITPGAMMTINPGINFILNDYNQHPGYVAFTMRVKGRPSPSEFPGVLRMLSNPQSICTLLVKRKSLLYLERTSTVSFTGGSKIIVEPGGHICMAGAVIQGNGTIEIKAPSIFQCVNEPFDNLFQDSACLVLSDSATLEIPSNSTVTFDGNVSCLKMNPHSQIKFGSNSKLILQNGAHLVADSATFTSLDENSIWDGIYLSDFANDTIKNCVIQNAANGINLQDKNYSVLGTPTVEISNCTFSNTTNTQLTNGIYVNNCSNVLIKGNNFTSSQLAQGFTSGIITEYCLPGSPVIVDNNIDKVLTGIFVVQSSPYIARNTITGITESGKGLELDNSNGTVKYNIVSNFINSYLTAYSSPYLLKNTFSGASETNVDLYNSSVPVMRPLNSGTELSWLAGNNIITGSPSVAGISYQEESYPNMDSGFTMMNVGIYNYMSGEIPTSQDGELQATKNYWTDNPPVPQRFIVSGGIVIYDPTFDGSSLPPTDYYDLNDIGFGLYDTIYIESLGDNPGADNLFMQAYHQEREHNYVQAINLYKQVITNYRNSNYAFLSVSRIFNCVEKKLSTNNEYQLLQNYMSQIRLNNIYHNELRELAEDFVIKAKVKQGLLQSAISDYEAMYQQNQNNHKGIHALINKECLIAMLNDSGDSPGTQNNFANIANHKLRLLSLITGRDLTHLKVTDNNQLPFEYKLYQNYPNPFNPKTTIKFDLPKEGFVTFKVYDVLGKEIYSVREYRTAGTHQLTIDGSNYASGLYFYRIETGSFVETKKMVLIK